MKHSHTLEELSAFGIYKITNQKTAKVYVGATTVSFDSRYREHLTRLKQGLHWNRHLQRSWHRNGRDRFIFEIVEVVSDRSVVVSREIYYIQEWRTWNRRYGYNILTEQIGDLARGTGKSHTCVSPDGEIFVTQSLKAFCAEQTLDYSGMRGTRDGSQLHHKGWRCYYSNHVPEKIESPEEFHARITKLEYDRCHHGKAAKTYRVIDPAGREFLIYNLRDFCSEHDLVYTEMAMLSKGMKGRFHHKLWRCYEPTQPYPRHDVFLKVVEELKRYVRLPNTNRKDLKIQLLERLRQDLITV
jgi:hypothetical protein